MPEDRDKVVALRRWERARCPGCGTTPMDWFDPATGEPLDPPVLEPYLTACHGCAEKGRLGQAMADPKTGRLEAGRAVGIRPFDAERPIVEPFVPGEAEVFVPPEWPGA
jgi:hypothetical protein